MSNSKKSKMWTTDTHADGRMTDTGLLHTTMDTRHSLAKQLDPPCRILFEVFLLDPIQDFPHIRLQRV